MSKQKIIAINMMIVTGALLIAPTTHAMSFQGSHRGELVEKIASRFHLEKPELEKVFGEHHEKMRLERLAKFEAQLDELVGRGKITKEQKVKILAKLEELAKNMSKESSTMSNSTHEQRRDFMKNKREELKNWAKTENIPLGSILPAFHKSHMRGGMKSFVK